MSIASHLTAFGKVETGGLSRELHACAPVVFDLAGAGVLIDELMLWPLFVSKSKDFNTYLYQS